jgi:hypothetical protein
MRPLYGLFAFSLISITILASTKYQTLNSIVEQQNKDGEGPRFGYCILCGRYRIEKCTLLHLICALLLVLSLILFFIIWGIRSSKDQ